MNSTLETAFAEEWPRVVGAILRASGSVDVAEESAQEAFARAADRIAAGEHIQNVGAWVTTTARHVAVDILRREAVFRQKLPLLAEPEIREDEVEEQDDRLGLVYVACDPLLSPEQQVALALRIVCGVPTSDIADFFGTSPATIAARLTRAKQVIGRSGERFAWPSAAARAERLGVALTTVYGVYTLGHTAVAGGGLMDPRLSALALLLARSIVAEYPADSESLGLLALIELGEARGVARTTADGMPLTLAEVDRSAWGRQRIRRGLDLAARALPGGGRFALQAGIAGLHSSAETWEQTDWAAISTLYFGLARVWPAPVVTLGAIIARSHLGASELDSAAEELRQLVGRRSEEFDRRVFAALVDVEERRGARDAAREALLRASLGEKNKAVLRYYARVAERLGA
ncbi:RNA polymerase sigma factor [Lacisediminihabitans sp. H27-G8]|uniref:RNA polymerase sigma factor n=1 Tax=Lacisediminihabitans sp. H27-G8 TaxID=3111909 RepID=UPI0038FC461D